MGAERFFATEGPPQPDINYRVDPLSRVDLAALEGLIEERRYFVLHAPRQTGKTTVLRALEQHLNTSGRYRALYANIEPAQALRNDVDRAMSTVVATLASEAARPYGPGALDRFRPAGGGPGSRVQEFLAAWAADDPTRPLVVLFDEVDALIGDSLLSFLRQLRAGYPDRPTRFPSSVVLCGVRDVRDYRLQLGSGEVVSGGCAFNIKAESLRLGDFSPGEIADLYGQHTGATGQVFTPDARSFVWEQTQGQPWLVNALAREATRRVQPDRSMAIDRTAMVRARELLIQRRDTHIDQLAARLLENRVRRVIEPILRSADRADFQPDDLQYTIDLGLVRRGPHGPEIANEIYREVVPRELTTDIEDGQLAGQPARPAFVRTDGSLDLATLLRGFQGWMRQHFESWRDAYAYREAAVQLLLAAFLQRIVNGGGRIEREYAWAPVEVTLPWSGHLGATVNSEPCWS